MELPSIAILLWIIALSVLFDADSRPIRHEGRRLTKSERKQRRRERECKAKGGQYLLYGSELTLNLANFFTKERQSTRLGSARSIEEITYYDQNHNVVAKYQLDTGKSQACWEPIQHCNVISSCPTPKSAQDMLPPVNQEAPKQHPGGGGKGGGAEQDKRRISIGERGDKTPKRTRPETGASGGGASGGEASGAAGGGASGDSGSGSGSFSYLA